MHQRQVAARPQQAVTCGELKAFGAEVEAARMLAGGHAPGQGVEGQRLQFSAQLGIHIAQRHIDQCGGHFSLAGVQPGAQCAVPPVQHDPQLFQASVLLDAGHVDPGELAIHLPGPVQKIAAPRQQRLLENRPETETVAPLGRRRGVQAHQVAVPAVAHHRVHLGQGQRRRRPHFIGPAHGAATHDKFGLGKQPVGHGAVAGLGVFRDIQPADKDFPVGGTAYVHFRPVDHQLLEAKPPQRGR